MMDWTSGRNQYKRLKTILGIKIDTPVASKIKMPGLQHKPMSKSVKEILSLTYGVTIQGDTDASKLEAVTKVP